MDAESSINPPTLENKFRDYIRQYRALLRWGVDKVFQDTGIDLLFLDIRKLIDSQQTEKAAKLLVDLKNQINLFEDQYPVQKNKIEKKLIAKIEQLESIIDKTPSINLNQGHRYLQTLEIARVAIQNDDWAEAQNRIESAEADLLTNDIFEKISISENTITVENLETAPAATPEAALAPAILDQATETEFNDDAAKRDTNLNAELGPIAQSLISTAPKSIIGKIVSIQDLQKTFHTLKKSDINNLRIGLIANPKVLNAELSCFSRTQLNVVKSDSQVALLRLSISRELTIYLVGIPLSSNLNFDQLKQFTPQLSSVFINTKNVSNNCVTKLSSVLTDISSRKNKVFLKDHLNTRLIKENASLNKLEYTLIEDSARLFIEDAAQYMPNYSKLK